MSRRDPPTDEEIRRLRKLFGASARALREHLGLSRIALATDAGLNDEAVARFERGESASKVDTLIRIACAMNVSLAQLAASMGQREGGGRQLTLEERTVAVTGLRYALEALTGGSEGDDPRVAPDRR